MKNIFVLILLISFSCIKKNNFDANKILENSILKHDPNSNFENLKIKFRIQEPRLQNPTRFSSIFLNNKTGEFSLERNRDSFISKHIVDENQISKTFLNGVISRDSTLIKKYRLDPRKNKGYRKYYRFFGLLPMSLKNEQYILENSFSNVIFNKTPAYKISLVLKEHFFSKHWHLFFSKKDFTFLGVEMFFPDDKSKGERILFDGEINVNNVILPRFRHWYELDGTYSGSDIIVSSIK